jgi:hypothetical protein
MGYGEERLRAIEEFLLSADLAQAVGGVRPLQNEARVYVLSNAPLPTWEVTQVAASEVFGIRCPLRRDGRENLDRYAAEAIRPLNRRPGWATRTSVGRSAWATAQAGI